MKMFIEKKPVGDRAEIRPYGFSPIHLKVIKELAEHKNIPTEKLIATILSLKENQMYGDGKIIRSPIERKQLLDKKLVEVAAREIYRVKTQAVAKNLSEYFSKNPGRDEQLFMDLLELVNDKQETLEVAHDALIATKNEIIKPGSEAGQLKIDEERKPGLTVHFTPEGIIMMFNDSDTVTWIACKNGKITAYQKKGSFYVGPNKPFIYTPPMDQNGEWKQIYNNPFLGKYSLTSLLKSWIAKLNSGSNVYANTWGGARATKPVVAEKRPPDIQTLLASHRGDR